MILLFKKFEDHNKDMEENNFETQQNRKLLYIIISMLFVLTLFVFKFYHDQKKENNALKIKVLTLGKDRRSPTPWQRLLNTPSNAPILTSNAISDKVTTRAASTTNSANSILDQSIENLDIQELALLLNSRMKDVKKLNLQALQKNIQIADEIISKDPESYSAYKAKLICLLIEEGKLNIPVDEQDINLLLETMANFDLSSDAVVKKEAGLISNTNNEMVQSIDELNIITEKKNQIELQMETLPPGSEELQNLIAQRATLITQEEDATNKITELQKILDSNNFPPEQYLNEDIVQIPFLRMMAKEDFNNVIDNANSFIEQFPNSIDGYYYLIKALEATGRHDEAVNFIQDSRLSPIGQAALQERLQNSKNVDFKHYWEKLNF